MATDIASLAPVQFESRLDAEREFYGSYEWCLNAYPSIGEVIQYLDRELTRYLTTDQDWRRDEIARNIYLLSSAILDTAEDYLLGRRYSFSKVLGVFPALAPLTTATQKILHAADKRFWLSRRQLWDWRVRWEEVMVGTLRSLLLKDASAADVSVAIAAVRELLRAPLPSAMRTRRPRIPGAFRSQDLTHFDVLSLGGKFIAAFPDRKRPLLVTGLRTAGSYFALLLRAYLETQGYPRVQCVTLRPKAGTSHWERERIASNARKNSLAVIIDEPVATGGTLGKGIALLNKHGISLSNVVVLFPVHRNGRNWKNHSDAQPLFACHVLSLEHHEWYKHKLIDSEAPKAVLQEYFRDQGWDAVVQSQGAEEANAHLKAVSEEKYHSRLKQVYSVRLARRGETTTRYILAKSVGWGWLGYHAFVAGNRLAGCVPPVLGLRDGILYSEWVHEANHKPLPSAEIVQTLARYVATRASELRFKADEGMDVTRNSQPARGLEELAGRLSGAYGKAGGVLKRARMKRELSAMESHQPALIDGRMRRMEWIPSDGTMLKSDYEHHGIGKHQLNLTDPAYDLAETILHWNLSEDEERELLDAYAAQSHDHNVHSRIFLHKILAGSWWMDRAIENINDPRLLARHGEFNRQYIEAWNFLVLQTMRFCAGLCHKPAQVRWSSPLAVLDVDGVIDKQVFGFPSTSMAGMQAISLLHQHGFAVMLNTARSIPEVKEYCRAYGFAGGVSEYGAHVWDAVSGEERVLISDDSLDKLARVRDALSRIPGTFLNDDFHYSIKAYTYDHGRCVPIPRVVVQDIVAALGIEGLGIHPTYTDTAIIATETDKARGMVELLRLAGLTEADTHAIGDTASDLPMFRVAVHSYAPGNVSCGPAAHLLKCRIARPAYQSGLLDSVRAMIQSTGTRNLQNPNIKAVLAPQDRYFVKLLETADRSSMVSLVRAAVDPMSLQTFIAE